MDKHLRELTDQITAEEIAADSRKFFIIISVVSLVIGGLTYSLVSHYVDIHNLATTWFIKG